MKHNSIMPKSLDNWTLEDILKPLNEVLENSKDIKRFDWYFRTEKINDSSNKFLKPISFYLEDEHFIKGIKYFMETHSKNYNTLSVLVSSQDGFYNGLVKNIINNYRISALISIKDDKQKKEVVKWHGEDGVELTKAKIFITPLQKEVLNTIYSIYNEVVKFGRSKNIDKEFLFLINSETTFEDVLEPRRFKEIVPFLEKANFSSNDFKNTNLKKYFTNSSALDSLVKQFDDAQVKQIEITPIKEDQKNSNIKKMR